MYANSIMVPRILLGCVWGEGHLREEEYRDERDGWFEESGCDTEEKIEVDGACVQDGRDFQVPAYVQANWSQMLSWRWKEVVEWHDSGCLDEVWTVL